MDIIEEVGITNRKQVQIVQPRYILLTLNIYISYIG